MTVANKDILQREMDMPKIKENKEKINYLKIVNKKILEIFKKEGWKIRNKTNENIKTIQQELVKKDLTWLPKNVIKAYKNLLESIATTKTGELVIDENNPWIWFVRMKIFNGSWSVTGYEIYYNDPSKEDNIRWEVSNREDSYCRTATGSFVKIPQDKKDKAYQRYKWEIYFVHDGKRYDKKTFQWASEEIDQANEHPIKQK